MKRGETRDKVIFPLLNLTGWEMITELSTWSWYDWESVKSEQKSTQIETVGEHIRRSGASESDVLIRGIETGVVDSAVINRVGPEVTSIQSVAREAIARKRPPPPPEI